MAKLHGNWAALADEYELLRNEPDKDDARALFQGLLHRDQEASNLATTEAPNDPKRMNKWTDQVFNSHRLVHG